jgi:hypothetical protein
MFILPYLSYAQECITTSKSAAPTASQQCKVSFSNYAHYPTFKIYVNVHFLQDEFGNNVDENQAVLLANQLIDAANAELTNLEPNEKTNKNGVASPNVGDTKYRYALYTESTNANDVYGGVFFHQRKDVPPNDFPYPYGSRGNRVINIVMFDDPGKSTVGGRSGTSGGNDIQLWNFQENNCGNGATRLWLYAKSLNHEMGHSLTLLHNTDCDNQCKNVDIDPDKECESTCPQLRTCDADNPLDKFDCNGNTVRLCPWGRGNNFMQQGDRMRALTPCQWETVYSFALDSKLPAYSWEDVCSINEPDLIIISNNEVWNFTQVLNRNVIIKTGAQLTINCLVKMGFNKRIIVERGAKLIVEAGKITKLCPDNWDGIYVHGNSSKLQPAPSTPIAQLAADDAGIVYIHQQSEISYANTAVTTDAPGYTYPNQVARWGGVIYVADSKFLNNNKAAAFMRYPISGKMTNVSKFQNCDFEINDINITALTAVTIWDTHGVEFLGNHFTNLPINDADAAISGIDYSANIENYNIFTNYKKKTLFAEATYPYHTKMSIKNNIFKGSVYTLRTIYFYAGINSPKGVKISGNEFNSYKVGVFLDGSTSFSIGGNTFNQNNNQAVYGLYARNTGTYVNLLNCNTFNGKGRGIVLPGDNGHTLFPRNTFNNSGIAILISADGATVGKVNDIQPYASSSGGFIVLTNKPSSNEFLNMAANNRPIRTPGTSGPSAPQTFNYYIPDDYVTKPHGAQYYPPVPYANADAFIFSEHGIPVPKTVCDNITTFTSSSFTGTLAQLRQQLVDFSTQLAANPNDAQLKFSHSALEVEIHDKIRREQEQMLEQSNYEGAISVLLAQPEMEYRRNAYGLRVEQGNYSAALSILNTLPTQNEDDQWFKGIQLINLNRFMATNKYQLSSAEDTYLTQIANSDSKERGYARALLDLLSGKREYEDPIIDDEGAMFRSMGEYTEEKIKENQSEDLVFIAPNPVTDDVMEINVKNLNIRNGNITFTNLLGYNVFSQSFSSAPYDRVAIDCSNFSPGLYAIRIMDGTRTLYEGKVSILK